MNRDLPSDPLDQTDLPINQNANPAPSSTPFEAEGNPTRSMKNDPGTSPETQAVPNEIQDDPSSAKQPDSTPHPSPSLAAAEDQDGCLPPWLQSQEDRRAQAKQTQQPAEPSSAPKGRKPAEGMRTILKAVVPAAKKTESTPPRNDSSKPASSPQTDLSSKTRSSDTNQPVRSKPAADPAGNRASNQKEEPQPKQKESGINSPKTARTAAFPAQSSAASAAVPAGTSARSPADSKQIQPGTASSRPEDPQTQIQPSPDLITTTKRPSAAAKDRPVSNPSAKPAASPSSKKTAAVSGAANQEQKEKQANLKASQQLLRKNDPDQSLPQRMRENMYASSPNRRNLQRDQQERYKPFYVLLIVLALIGGCLGLWFLHEHTQNEGLDPTLSTTETPPEDGSTSNTQDLAEGNGSTEADASQAQDSTHGELPILTITDSAETGNSMGVGAIMAYDGTEFSVQPIPMSELPDVMPVYVSGNKNMPDTEAMRSMLKTLAQQLSLDVDSLHFSGSALDPKETAKVEKLLTSSDDAYQKLTELFSLTMKATASDGTTMTIQKDGEVFVQLGQPVPLSVDPSLSTGSKEYLQLAGEEILQEHRNLIPFVDPVFFVDDGDYTYIDDFEVSSDQEVEPNFSLEFYNNSSNPLKAFENYNLRQADYYIDESGTLWGMRIYHYNTMEKAGDYPIITQQEATERLISGQYTASVPAELQSALHSEQGIVQIDLVYQTLRSDDYYMPWYVFYIELPADLYTWPVPEGVHNYGIWSVPAIQSQYIDNPTHQH